jgi:hypothetical protein
MGNLSGFDANTVEPNQFDVIPAGEYEATIVKSQMKPTKDGQGSYLELELQVLNGQYQNRKLFDRLNLKNASAKAVQIAQGTLSAICRSVGVLTPNDSSELHNKPLRVKVKVTKDEQYGDKNEIVAYKPRQAGPSQPQPLAQSEGQPWPQETTNGF